MTHLSPNFITFLIKFFLLQINKKERPFRTNFLATGLRDIWIFSNHDLKPNVIHSINRYSNYKSTFISFIWCRRLFGCWIKRSTNKALSTCITNHENLASFALWEGGLISKGIWCRFNPGKNLQDNYPQFFNLPYLH